MKSAKFHALSRFSLVVLVVLTLSASIAFAKKPVKETYSWSVYVPLDSISLQGGVNTPVRYLDGVGDAFLYNDPETTRNFVNIINRSYSYFNFEILLDSEIELVGLDPQCCEEDEAACDPMFSALANPLPNDPYVRIWFGFPSFSGYKYDEHPYEEEEVEVFLARGYFNIDANYVGEPKIYPHPDVISGDFVGSIGDITVTRKSENMWHIRVALDDTAGIVNLEHLITDWGEKCNKKGNVCSPYVISQTRTEGTANPMTFDLYFVREIISE